MNKKISFIIMLSISAILLCINACCLESDPTCPTPQATYAIDNLPGSTNPPTYIDQKMLTELVELIEAGEFGDIQSLIIIHNDDLVLEEYFMGWTRHMRHFCASVTKVFTSALIGIAIEQGYIDGVDEKLLSFFPEYDDIANLDERKKSITIRHLLTMSSGFLWNSENNSEEMFESNDWIKYILDRPMSDDPGTKWNYNSGCSHLLSAILTKQTGQSTEEFARENLFKPLGITNWLWLSSPDGITTGGWGLDLHPVNMAIFGYLYLKNGLFNGRQVVSEEWIQESTAKHIEVIDPDTGIHGTDYGYQWFRMLPIVDFRMFDARGGGGQSIAILPDHNMVVVMTAENMETHTAPVIQILIGHILPAVKEK